MNGEEEKITGRCHPCSHADQFQKKISFKEMESEDLKTETFYAWGSLGDMGCKHSLETAGKRTSIPL